MKKYLLPTIALVALAACGSSTKVTASGTIEDRRTPITVPVSLTAPTTVPATTPPTFTEYVPTTVGLVYATPELLSNDRAIMDGLENMITDSTNIWAAVDAENIPALTAACQEQIGHAVDVSFALDAYTGPMVDDITVGLGMFVVADQDCIDGNYVDAADEFEAAGEYWTAMADALS